jgi:hypothetical protein
MAVYSVTEAIVAWLADAGYEAHALPPAEAPDSPDEFVTVERTGGYVENMVDHPVVAIQAWARTEARAEEMSNEIRNLALLSERPRGVHRIDVDSGPYPFYDEGTRCPRYQLVLDVTCQLID